ncbi:hypothetical protein BaRGS_00015386 [Batillaria attramentaria]|uniref:Uncharacterized protein n=1 Tax=Batillaria attramentaria TaxID=370345 RepID=A0ABD0L1T3_9CAEN
MKLLLLLGLTLATLVFCKAEVGTPCTSQDQCAADECCQIVNIVVMSRRQALRPLGGPNTSGTCEKYKKEGESCSSIAVMNGYCGCQPGLNCTPIGLSTLRSRRRELPIVWYKCSPPYNDVECRDPTLLCHSLFLPFFSREYKRYRDDNQRAKCRQFRVLLQLPAADMKFLFLLCLIIAALAACEDQCADDECCQIVNIIVASRKRQFLLQPIRPYTSGTCQKYKTEGESCSSIAVMNGYCGCKSGLRCTPVDLNLVGGLARRMELPATCEAN